MATRLLAKKYLREILGAPLVPPTERDCLEMLIDSHRSLRDAEQIRLGRATARSWFGRLLWRLFGRWL